MRRQAPLILASRSPRRAALLRQCGYRFLMRPTPADESLLPGESGLAAAQRLAAAKAIAAASRIRRGTVLAADTLVLAGRHVLGKPAGAADARRMLRILSGRAHRVVTGVAVCGPAGRSLVSGRSVTWVTFRAMSPREIDWYVSTGEPLDKAGGYGIQGIAGLFIPSIRGSFSNVIGLPLDLVHALAGPPPVHGSRS